MAKVNSLDLRTSYVFVTTFVPVIHISVEIFQTTGDGFILNYGFLISSFLDDLLLKNCIHDYLILKNNCTLCK